MSLNEDPHAMLCWKCQKKIGESPMKIGFRAVCMHCDVDLHVCKRGAPEHLRGDQGEGGRGERLTPAAA